MSSKFSVISLIILWGLAGPAAMLSMQYMAPYSFRFVSLILGGLLLLIIAFINGEKIKLSRNDASNILLISIFNIAGYYLLSAFAMIKLNVGRASILGYTMPFWTICIEIMLGNKINTRTIQSVSIGIIGITLLLISVYTNSSFNTHGFFLMIGAAISWAIGTVILRRMNFASNSPSVITSWMLIFGGMLILPLYILFPIVTVAPITISAICGLLYTVLIAFGVCQAMWFRLLKEIPSYKASMYLLGIPPVSVISGYFILNSQVSNLDIIALGLLLLATIITNKI